MTHLRLLGFALTVAAAMAAGAGAEPVEITMTNGQGEIAGEVTATSVILQTRLTSKAGWVDGDLPGVDGVARFEVATDPDFADPITTDWLTATVDSDHIVKAKIDGLSPGTEYLYRVVYGPDPEHTENGATRSFATHPGADAAARTSFTVVTGMNYYHFYDNPNRAYTGPDKELGFPGLASMLVGPDDADQAGRAAENHDPVKRDNHSNPGGFRHERDELFAWLIDNGFLEKDFYIVTGDRHWQYRSLDPTGFEEFSTGALVDANSRVGRPPGDPDSNDPDALVMQYYTYDEPTGGFLNIVVTPGDQPTAAFRFYDEQGELLYEDVKTAS